MDANVKKQFEQIFVKHYERLANSRQSVGGMEFTLERIVCFILFGGRELDIEDVYGDVSERYSMETFTADARDAGIETDEGVMKAVQELVDKKFLHLQPDGKFYSYQATRETARMLNRIYPKMQGLSLLAYIGQTLQEVESGRIDPSSAVSRFDQTLQHHGVALPKPKIPVIEPAKPAAQPKKDQLKPQSRNIIRDYVVATPGKPKGEKPPEPTEPPVRTPAAPPAPAPPVIEAAPLPLAPMPPEEQMHLPAEPELEPSLTHLQEALPPEPDEPQQIVDDEAIAAKIAAFEKELALVCPICKTNVLKEEKTAAGKLFYTCSSPTCNFISWGRPHHIACARCKNPFMVEVTDSSGQMILKCPRATCQHRQALTASPAQAGGVKKVVRKRLVRRKV